MSGWLSNTEAWIEHHPGDAAWVQAIGATLAVATALLVPALQARNARRQRDADRRLRAKSLAIAIYPELLHIRMSYRRITHQWQAEIEEIQQAGNAGSEEIEPAAHKRRLTIPISEALRAMVPLFYLLGEPIGPEVQKCIGRSMKYNDLLHNMTEPLLQIASSNLLRFAEQGLKDVESCLAAFEHAWGIRAPEAEAFEKQIADAIDSAPALLSHTITKETV